MKLREPTPGELKPLAHAILSASGSKKWMTCAMSAAMEHGLPEEDSDFSREGTYGHKLFELRLRCFLGGHDGADIETERAACDPDQCPEAAEFLTKEFSDHVDEAVNYTIARIEELWVKYGFENVTVLLEQRLDFSRWVPQGFGTGDVVIIVPGRIIVIDLKMGAGYYVDGVDNSQLKLYALGAWVRYDMLYDFEEVEVVIHQPRKENVGGEVIPVVDLLAWAGTEVAPRAHLAWANLQARIEGKTIVGQEFTPGEHCSSGFCKARFTCPARLEKHMSLADEDFALAEPDTLTIEQLEDVAERAQTLAKWANDVRAYLLRQANDGKVTLQRYVLAEGRSNRVITDPVKAAVALQHHGYAARDIYKDPELVGITQLEKLVGAAKLKEVLGELIEKPKGATTLALADSKNVTVVAPRRESAETDFA